MLPTLLLSLAGVATAAWTLQDDYISGGNFFSNFQFYTSSDPTHGFVQYQSQSAAQNLGLISQSSSNVYIGTDHSNKQPNGRPSVRIQSYNTYNSGLFLLDLQHMPGGICGTWPAFWLLGDDWPSRGEIDIVEGVNDGNTNAQTLHTAQGCSLQNAAMTGHINTYDCWVNDPNQSANAGCSIGTSNTQTYGSDFNNNGGGVYAVNFQNSAISMWFFPRGSIPTDIKNGSPNPDGWGEPASYFSGCSIDQFINNQHIVFDLTFCGDWAGNVWGSSSCANLDGSCTDYVANNPSAFQNAYWSINSLKVYQLTSGNGNYVVPQSNATTMHTTFTQSLPKYSMTMA